MIISDFHSHILPGIDDGSSSLEESVSMLQEEVNQGISHVVMTPHFYADKDSLEGFVQRRTNAAQRLRNEIQAIDGLPKISLGAEVYYFRGIGQVQEMRHLAIEGTNYIMIEMPPSTWTQTMYRDLVNISEKLDLQPVIAHIDRYIRPMRDNEHLEELEQLPVLLQANGNFFKRYTTQRMALRMLKQNRIHFLGSDCHNMASRPPNLGSVVDLIRKKLGEDKLQKIAENEAVCFGINSLV